MALGNLLTLTLRNMDSMSSEPSSFPNQTAFLGKKRRDFAADEFVGDGLVGVGVQFVGVGHFPGAAEGSVVIAHACKKNSLARMSENRGITAQDIPVSIVSTFVFLA